MSKIILKVLVTLPFFMFFTSFLKEEHEVVKQAIDPPFIGMNSQWVDSLMNKMTLDEKIGQLFMIGVFSNKGDKYTENQLETIKKYNIGGIMYHKGTPTSQAEMTNAFQRNAKVPLFVAIDGEWGLGMRLDSTTNFPRQMMLGAIQDEDIIYEMGTEIARQCKRIGININFAPVLDINNNPRNPVINSRSFGENRLSVARKGFAYMAGMQDNKILSVAKHFPGHGDTEVDSHKDLPIINYSKKRLDSLELYPFAQLIKAGIGGVMAAHLYIPTIDSTANQASSLSPKIITDLLKKELNFKGLVFTDGLGMHGVTKYNHSGQAEVKALVAGSDVLLLPKSIEEAMVAIKEAIEKKIITEASINEKCKKILMAKRWLGLDKVKPINLKNIVSDLNNSNAELVKRHLISSAITIVQNSNNLIPLKNLDSLKIASVSVGSGEITKFQTTLGLYTDVKHFAINKNSTYAQFEALINDLSGFNLIIVGVHSDQFTPPWFGLNSETFQFVNRLSQKSKMIVDIFASPYTLDRLKNRNNLATIVMSYEDSELCQDLSAQLIFGGIAAKGRLPISASASFPVNTGFLDKKIRLQYSIPKELDINELKLRNIDTVAMNGIEQGAYPGCEILVAKNGVVFYHKAFGYQSSDKKDTLKLTDLFDLASVTKIVATVPSLMKLYDEGKFDVNEKLSTYLPALDSTNKKNMTIIDVLHHQARLNTWIPFHLKAFERQNRSIKRKTDLYRGEKSDSFPHEVAEKFFLRKDYVDSIMQMVYDSPLKKRKQYSDLGFYMFYKIINELTRTTLDSFVETRFYRSLGATTLTYNPLRKFDISRIVPTEDDQKLRKQLIHGHVHDYGAALMGGVCGHAGVFSNANDLAKLLQMFLQRGEYGGKRYLKAETLDLFTSSDPTGRSKRGLGFDKPGIAGKSPVCKAASAKSYGHTGFTGTIVWVDPEEQLIYIFLSNRVNPKADNDKLAKLSIRHKIQAIIYDAIKIKKNT